MLWGDVSVKMTGDNLVKKEYHFGYNEKNKGTETVGIKEVIHN